MMLHPRLLFLVLVLMNSLSAAIAQTAYLESDSIVEGEVAVLVIKYSNNLASLYALDTSKLEQDFQVLSVSPSLSKQLENEKLVNIMRWEVLLAPRHSGTIIIPVLTIKDYQTPQLSLKVNEGNAGKDLIEKVFFQVSSDRSNPYQGEQFIVTARLFHNRNLLSGFITEPETEDSEINRIVGDSRYQAVIEGENYEVLERRIAVMATSVGRLLLPGFEFLGSIDLGGHAEGANSNNSRRIWRQSDPLRIDIQPEQTTDARPWLPLRQLRISQQWKEPEKGLVSGDSISRNITLLVENFPAALLPDDLLEVSAANMKVYLDQPEREDFVDGDRLVASFRQTQVIVFSGMGEIKVPDLTIDWWDIEGNKQRRSVLPGRKISIAAVEAVYSQPSPLTSPPFANWYKRLKVDFETQGWSWLALVGLLCLLLLSGLIYRYRKTGISAEQEERFKPKLLQRACRRGDRINARRQIILWLQEAGLKGARPGLIPLAKSINDATLAKELLLLDASLYGSQPAAWQGYKLWLSYYRYRPVEKSDSPKTIPAYDDLYAQAGQKINTTGAVIYP